MSLDVRDVEKLENTSFATALAGGDVGAATTLDASCALEGSTPDIIATVTALFTHHSAVDCTVTAVHDAVSDETNCDQAFSLDGVSCDSAGFTCELTRAEDCITSSDGCATEGGCPQNLIPTNVAMPGAYGGFAADAIPGASDADAVHLLDVARRST